MAAAPALAPLLRDRALAVAIALLLHGAALGVAVLVLDSAGRSDRPPAVVARARDVIRLVLWRNAVAREAPLDGLARGHELFAHPPRRVAHEESAELVVPPAAALRAHRARVRTLARLSAASQEKAVHPAGPAAASAPAFVPPGGPPDKAPAASAPGSTGLDELGDSSARSRIEARHGDWQEIAIAGSLVVPPKPSRYCVPQRPVLPEAARLRGVSGRVEALYDVDSGGVVGAVSVVSAPHPLLAEAVQEWLHGCLFEPQLKDGHPSATRVRQSFNFVLR